MDTLINGVENLSISNQVSPDAVLSICQYSIKIGIEEQHRVRVSCLKCSKIIENPDFTPEGNKRPYMKFMRIIELEDTPEFKKVLDEATKFPKGNGHHQFKQITKNKQLLVLNFLFQQQIPDSFHNCINGVCNKP